MDFPPLPRRRFLKVATLAGGVLALAASPARATLAAKRLPHYRTPAGRMLVLNTHRATVLECVADTLIVTGEGFPSVRDAGVARRIDEELFFIRRSIRNDVLLAIDAIDLLPIAYGRFSRLHRMAPDVRRRFLEGLADTRIDSVRAMVSGLRLVTGMMYYGHPATWAAIGYEGPFSGLPPRESEQRAYYREQTQSRSRA